MFTLDNAIVYDEECLPNVWTLYAEMLHSDASAFFMISEWRDDRAALFQWLNGLHRAQVGMIGFHSIAYDYPLLHFLFMNKDATIAQLYQKSQQIIKNNNIDNPFAHSIYAKDRLTPQIDLLKIHHFDNKAKRTSLKALQVNMRLRNVIESALPFDQPATREQIEQILVPYNIYDVKSTKEFAHISKEPLEFRAGLIPQFDIDVMNYSDVKIGAKIFEQRLGEDVCYDRSSGRKRPRQTVRHQIPLRDIIFPYIRFEHPEFQRVLEYMKAQVLTPDDLDDPNATVKTKGVFKNLIANVGGLDFYFGTGGMHASVPAQRFVASEEWLIRDIDVKSLYPSIAIANDLAPAHLYGAFRPAYQSILDDRAKHAKGTVQNAAFKLGANGPWGQSNNKFTIFFDSQYAMAVPINGQLLISMLAEWLLKVPTFQLIQVNTDGITYRIHAMYEPQAAAICKQWEQFTCLTLEDANYQRMWIRDVNSYIAEDMKGKLKQKGAYWYPEPGNYNDSISKSSPPAWHKDLSALITIRAATAFMVHGIDPETYIRAHTDPFDFMCRVKVQKDCQLWLGNKQVQRTFRYFIARDGDALVKLSPAKGPIGAYKRRTGMSDAEYNAIAATVAPGVHDERIHTKNKSVYAESRTDVQSGWKIVDCCNADNFSFDRIDYSWYLNETKKLII